MIYALLLVALYAIVIVASVSQNAFQDAVNAFALLVFAALLIAIILVAAYAFALHANAISEEDVSHLAIMSVITIAKNEICIII